MEAQAVLPGGTARRCRSIADRVAAMLIARPMISQGTTAHQRCSRRTVCDRSDSCAMVACVGPRGSVPQTQ
jgi:hypothetical protein